MCRLTLSVGMREVKGTHSLAPNVQRPPQWQSTAPLSTSAVGPNNTRQREILTAYLHPGKSFRSGFLHKRTSPEQSTEMLAQKVWVWFYSHHCSLRVHKMFLLSDQWETAEHHRTRYHPHKTPHRIHAHHNHSPTSFPPSPGITGRTDKERAVGLPKCPTSGVPETGWDRETMISYPTSILGINLRLIMF